MRVGFFVMNNASGPHIDPAMESMDGVSGWFRTARRKLWVGSAFSRMHISSSSRIAFCRGTRGRHSQHVGRRPGAEPRPVLGRPVRGVQRICTADSRVDPVIRRTGAVPRGEPVTRPGFRADDNPLILHLGSGDSVCFLTSRCRSRPIRIILRDISLERQR